MKKALLVLAGLVALVLVGGIAWVGPSNVIGFVRYGQTDEGSLKPNDPAPDVPLVSLDGATFRSLSEFIGPRPLVLIFGSFT
jgi:hypothetical protein